MAEPKKPGTDRADRARSAVTPDGGHSTTAPDTPEARFEDLVLELAGVEGVTPPSGGRGFGRSALRAHGKIFAMLVRGRLVLKLPAERVEELVASGDGEPFDANKGTPMREWLALDPESGQEWSALAREALGFAGRQRR